VAYRVASCARSAEARRRRHERRASELAGPGLREDEPDDLGGVLHEEVNRLPWGYRIAVTLCYFEGLSPEEAAGRLGCPVGTVQSRLARGRERLRVRLTRRGLAPALGALAAGADARAATPPAALVEATVRAALPKAAETVSGSVGRLTREVLRTMFLLKVRTAAVVLVSAAALGAGALAFLQPAQTPRPRADLDRVRAELGARPAKNEGPPREDVDEAGPPPRDLAWAVVAPAERLRVIGLLAEQSRGNFEKIKTWQGVYAYQVRQRLEEKFVAQIRAGAAAAGNQPPARVPAGALLQEFDSTLTFDVDTAADAIYREIETSRMRFLKPGTDEEVTIPNLGTDDHRSVLTPDAYVFFRPKQRWTSAFLPDHPDAQRKPIAERFPVKEAQFRESGAPDPRTFFKFDPANFFWTGLELEARVLKGEVWFGGKKALEERLELGQADGPGGKWYRHRMGYDGGPGRMLWVTTLWSPQAGYNPVRSVSALGQPDGMAQTTIEWQWKSIDGIYVPASIKESNHLMPAGELSRGYDAVLTRSTLNRPLGPHQFDERGLGLGEGDLVLNHLERVAYIIKGGEPVKLANFGEGSVLRNAAAKPKPAPAPANAPAAQARRKPAGLIYTTASLETDERGLPIPSVVSVDPESGEVTKLFDGFVGRRRVSPDGRSVAYVAGDWTLASPPWERTGQGLFTRSLSGDGAPKRLVRLERPPAGDLPVWSPDGKQIILSVGTRDEARKQWVYETFRVNADGSGREALEIPPEDCVQDWSPDGAWVVTASSRNAKIGWQLYVMRPDGRDQRQMTEGGNPFYARFSPDGKRLLYSDGTMRLLERRGVWVVDVDGKNRRRVFPTGNETASACWSPDGRRIVVALRGEARDDKARLEVVDLDGPHRTLLTLPGRDIADMPDWR
jgi:hypothetical protein